MAGHDNDHELTRISVREEVERALEELVPGKQRQEVAARVEQIFERRTGPLPDLGHITGLDQLVPGCGREIVSAALREMEHRREVQKRELDLHQAELDLMKSITSGEFRSVREGRLLGSITYGACFAFSFVAMYMHANQVALAAIGTAAVGVVVQIVRGGWSPSVRITSEGPTPTDNKKAPPTRNN
jgi:hypothetical protein